MEPLIFAEEAVARTVVIRGQTYHVRREDDLTVTELRKLAKLRNALADTAASNDGEAFINTMLNMLLHVSDIPLEVLEGMRVGWLTQLMMIHRGKEAGAAHGDGGETQAGA